MSALVSTSEQWAGGIVFTWRTESDSLSGHSCVVYDLERVVDGSVVPVCHGTAGDVQSARELCELLLRGKVRWADRKAAA